MESTIISGHTLEYKKFDRVGNLVWGHQLILDLEGQVTVSADLAASE